MSPPWAGGRLRDRRGVLRRDEGVVLAPVVSDALAERLEQSLGLAVGASKEERAPGAASPGVAALDGEVGPDAHPHQLR